MPERPSGPAPFVPDYQVPPGASLREKLAELGLTQADLALRTGLSTKHVNQVVQGFAPITQESALLFEAVTGIPAHVWNQLEASYRESLARTERRKALAADLGWLDELPIHELQRRGYLPKLPDRYALLEKVCEFFGVTDRDSWKRAWLKPAASFRRSPTLKGDSSVLVSWVRMAETDAMRVQTKPYDAGGFRRILTEARSLTLTDAAQAFPRLQRECATVGVATVLVEEIAGARVSGVARWLSPTKAMIALTGRGKREDLLWFSFFHEAAHVLKHSKKETFIDDDVSAGDPEEVEANRLAELMLIPREYEHRLTALASTEDIVAFADEVGVAPGTVVGRLQSMGVLGWRVTANKLKRKFDPRDTPQVFNGPGEPGS